MTEVRGGVYPFCRSCTASSTAWRAPDPTRRNGLGTHFYGHRDVCPHCSSSVRTLYVTFLSVPISRVGRYRIIRTGGRSYVGRKLLDQPVPDTTPLERPPSEFENHPELADATYEEAKARWAAGDAAGALPLYETSLTACEKVLKADDPATLRIRLRVAQALLATGDYGAAISWFGLITPQLVRVFGAGHDLTRIAIEGITGAQLKVGGPRAEIKLLTARLAELEQSLDRKNPSVLRTREALGRATMFAGQLVASIQILEKALADSIDSLGADHPDTNVARGALKEACELADSKGKKDREAGAGARRRWL
jgi:Tetratricopeptide repeat